MGGGRQGIAFTPVPPEHIGHLIDVITASTSVNINDMLRPKWAQSRSAAHYELQAGRYAERKSTGHFGDPQ